MTLPLLPGRMYHLYNHANGDESLFREDDNYRYFLHKYVEHISPIAETYAYCLMPNHFHFFVRMEDKEVLMNKYQDVVKAENRLADFISGKWSNFFNAYTKAFNKKYDRKGNLFQQNFKRRMVDNDRYAQTLLGYIHLNPVKHGFCKSILDWPYSSVQGYYLDKKTRLNRKFSPTSLGDREALVNFHASIKIEESVFDW
ncbi:MAG: transposase [Cytophagaceae bacterium]